MAAYKKADDRKKILNFVRKLMKTKNDESGLKGQKLKKRLIIPKVCIDINDIDFLSFAITFIDESKISELWKEFEIVEENFENDKSKSAFMRN